MTEMILKKVIDIIAELACAKKDQITPETSLKQDLGADELTIAQLFMAIEEEFGIEIPDDEELEVGTIQDAAALVERYSL